MNYRHAYHAGNFADVAKHIALVGVLLHLRKKETPFAVIDTHAGRGLYDLEGSEASRTGEADAGIARLRDLAVPDAPEALRTYLGLAAALGSSRYPGSPLIAARLLRPQDRLIAIDKHPEEEVALANALRPFARARAITADGFARLPALLPPPERRGVVLIDPPYESEAEFTDVAKAIGAGLKRFATGIYIVWFPVKSTIEAERFCGEVLSAGATRALRVDITIAAPERESRTPLSTAGLVVINPPYGLDGEMRASLSAIAPALKSESEVTWLAGD
jgi:23S rRNA (adenine2030-N6)-methyltransferase